MTGPDRRRGWRLRPPFAQSIAVGDSGHRQGGFGGSGTANAPNMNATRLMLLALIGSVALVALACGPDDNVGIPFESDGFIIVEPTNGAIVSPGVDVVIEVEGFVVEPAGRVRNGAGHIHVITDGTCVAPGQLIPFDNTHVHLGDGSTSTVLDLDPGQHTLCVQAGDGSHIALDLTDTVTFTVAG